jgi:serine/threonine protein kinase
MMLEYSRVANAPMYLDRAELGRYKLIIAHIGFTTHAEITTCIFLLRIMKLAVHPEIVLIADNEKELRLAKTTGLGDLTCVLKSQVTTATISSLLAQIAGRENERVNKANDGAPSLAGYRICEPVAGTYGATVYRAYSEQMGADVALKICDLNSTKHDRTHQLTLRQEYETLRKLGGKYVARTFDYGEVDGVSYMALEYFPRGSIGNLFASKNRIASRIGYLRRVAEALRYIHEVGFLHLDLKPNNVLIRADGSPVLIDFGISTRIVAARHLEGQISSMGSPYFMSPEQARCGALDERSDLYSFGALWYRILTGMVPFQGRTFAEIFSAHDEGGPPPDMGFALRHYQPIVDKTLAAAPEDRFSSAQELIDSIDYHTGTATGVFLAPHYIERRSIRYKSAQELCSHERRRGETGERNRPHVIP